MRVLITGASGFIGGHLLHSAPSEFEVWGTYFDHLISFDTARMLRLDLRHGDSIQAILDGLKPDMVIHGAAFSRVGYCQIAPTAAWELNSRATAHLGAYCQERNIRLMLLSSDMVFNGEKGNYSERDLPNPINFYGWTKLAAERRIQGFGFNSIIARINLTYGKPVYGGSSFSDEIIRTIQSGENYPLFVDQSRSFISIKNLVQCLWELVASDFAGTIHLGGPDPVTRLEFAEKLAHVTGFDKNFLERSSPDDLVPEVPYPENNTFDIRLAEGVLRTRLLGIDEGLALEYTT